MDNTTIKSLVVDFFTFHTINRGVVRSTYNSCVIIIGVYQESV